mmetsp:Transcript_27634/g.50341  ORF Transcript_27634/g.50341 Transcript_27634/m.50341 type:complete len:247 (-) Transcript_27634:444-1184(-)
MIHTPPSRRPSGHDAALPHSPPTPKRMGKGWNLFTVLFGDGGPPSSPSASMIAGTHDGNEKVGSHGTAAPRHQSFDCKLEKAEPSIGKEDSVNNIMDILESGDTGQYDNFEESEPNMPPMPPPVNRKLKFDIDDFNDSVFKSQFQSRSSVNTTAVCSEPNIHPPDNRKLNFGADNFNDSVFKTQFQSRSSANNMTVCREDSRFSFEEENNLIDEFRSLAYAKQHAFEIAQQFKKGGSRARKRDHLM